jgi:DNA polymerase-3 subunit alpha
MTFAHLHVHSDYSILDSSISIKRLVAQAKAKGMTALALTDHGHGHGLVHFYLECLEQGIKPILGCELYVARRSAREKMDRIGGNPTDHLVVLARDKEGYENILKMISWGNQFGFHSVPRVDLSVLAEHSRGIIATTACLSGGVNRLMAGWDAYNPKKRAKECLQPDSAAAEKLAGQFRDIFGPGGFFLEVQRHAGQYGNAETLAKQLKVEEAAYQMAARLGIPMLATNDIHFENPEDAAAREIAYMIARGKTESSQDFDAITHAGEMYVKTPAEMAVALQGRHETLLSNTLWIAEQCNVKLDTGKFHFASPIDEQGEMTPERMQLTWDRVTMEGFQTRFPAGHPDREKAWERFTYEKGQIEKMGFVPYFLVVWDFVHFARRSGIRVGKGRGSVVGCLIAYCMKITDIEPMRYDLLFERFLNPERVSMPDMDIDFDKDRVREVIDYVAKKYGRERVARISTFGRMWAKQVIRDVGRVLELPQEKLAFLGKALPDAQGEFRMSIAQAVEEVPEIQELAHSADPKEKRLLEISKKLEGIRRTVSTHACGIVIGDVPVVRHSALSPVKKNDFGGILQSELDMESLEKLGLLKFDFLNLDTLTIIGRTEGWIRQRHNPTFSIEDDSEYADPATYDLICQGRTIGAFQFESAGMRELCMRVQPRNLEDLAIISALYRPGPLDAVDDEGMTMVDHYALRRHGTEPVEYEAPPMEKPLKVTYGVMVYQEQIMRVAQNLCGYTLGQADLLRKAIGKKKPEAIMKEKERFIPAAQKVSGISEALAQTIWSQIETFGRYGFNKSHAIGYSATTYQTMYLKAHYPVEFMASCLASAVGWVPEEFREEGYGSDAEGWLRSLIDECGRMGVEILEPDVNVSTETFWPVGDKIRMGLGAIKGIGVDAAKIISARTRSGGTFTSFRQLIQACVAAGVGTKSLETLVASGAVDRLGERNQMLVILKDTAASAKEVAKVGDVPSFVTLPEQMPSIYAMTDDMKRAQTLELLGAYSVQSRTAEQIGVVCKDIAQAEWVVSILKAYPGGVGVYGTVQHNGAEVRLHFGSCSGSAEVIEALRKVVPVKET